MISSSFPTSLYHNISFSTIHKIHYRIPTLKIGRLTHNSLLGKTPQIFHISLHVVHHILNLVIVIFYLKGVIFLFFSLIEDLPRCANLDSFYLLDLFRVIPRMIRMSIAGYNAIFVIFYELNPGWEAGCLELALFTFFDLEVRYNIFFYDLLLHQNISTFEYVTHKLACVDPICDEDLLC